MRLNKEDFEYIKQYEEHFAHALYDGYFRILNRNMLRDFYDIYRRVFGRDSKILNGCNRCVLQDIKDLAKAYFNDKNDMAKEAEIKSLETIEDEKPIDMPKKNKTAPKGKKTTKK